MHSVWLLQYAKRKSHHYLDERTVKIFNKYGVDQVNYLNKNNNNKRSVMEIVLKIVYVPGLMLSLLVVMH